MQLKPKERLSTGVENRIAATPKQEIKEKPQKFLLQRPCPAMSHIANIVHPEMSGRNKDRHTNTA